MCKGLGQSPKNTLVKASKSLHAEFCNCNTHLSKVGGYLHQVGKLVKWFSFSNGKPFSPKSPKSLLLPMSTTPHVGQECQSHLVIFSDYFIFYGFLVSLFSSSTLPGRALPWLLSARATSQWRSWSGENQIVSRFNKNVSLIGSSAITNETTSLSLTFWGNWAPNSSRA